MIEAVVVAMLMVVPMVLSVDFDDQGAGGVDMVVVMAVVVVRILVNWL